MSNNDEMSDFLSFWRTYKQMGSQNPAATSSQRALSQRPPVQQRASRQAPVPHPQNHPAYNQGLHDVKRLLEEIKHGHDGIFVVLNGIQNILDNLKSTLEDNMARMNGNMERFEIIGRGVLQMAVQPSAAYPPVGSSSQPSAPSHPQVPHQPASRPQVSPGFSKSHGPEPSATQPLALAPLPTAQAYAPPTSSASDTYADPHLVDFSQFLNEI